jgi:hypothetical protein
MRGGRFAALSCADDGDDSTGDDDGDDGDDVAGDGEPANKRRRWGRSPAGSPGSVNGAAIHPFGDGDDDEEHVDEGVSEGDDDDDDDVDVDGEGGGDDDGLGAVDAAQQQPNTFDKLVEDGGRPKWVCKLCPPDAKRRSKSAADHRNHLRAEHDGAVDCTFHQCGHCGTVETSAKMLSGIGRG